jgi:hypothetical protein
VPEAWSERIAELSAVLGRGQPLASGGTGDAAWEGGRARSLAGFSSEEQWLIGLNDHLWSKLSRYPMVPGAGSGGPGGVFGHHPRTIVETMWITPVDGPMRRV